MRSEDPFRIFTKGKKDLNVVFSDLSSFLSLIPSFFSFSPPPLTRDGREQVAEIILYTLCCRYKVLLRDLALPEDIRGKCTVLLQFYDASNTEWQLGKTKVQWPEQGPPCLPRGLLIPKAVPFPNTAPWWLLTF